MTIDSNDLLKSLAESISRIEYVKAEDIPNIDLYMDQVTSFLEEHLRNTTRNKVEDKLLTKTMINNYAKNDILPPPVKKKYSKDHVITLLLIYYFKYFLSISDIETILSPLNKNYFGKKEGMTLVDIYEELRIKEAQIQDSILNDITSKYMISKDMYNSADEQEASQLQLFAFISLLSEDVYIKKLLIEKLVDDYREKAMKDDLKKESKKDKKETKKELKNDN